jgi:predicted RNase H-like HicB family nuclease
VRFDLYLESGPQHRKTWVYVPGLPGCSTVAPTSAEATVAARSAIRERFEFLLRHGEEMPDPEPIELVVAEHFIERKYLGFGQGTFPTDREPMTRDEAARQLLWAGWSREELVAAARAQEGPLAVKPAAGGRSAAEILSHVAGAEWSYVSSTLGTLAGGSAAIAAVERAPEDPWAALESERAKLTARLAAMTDEELARIVERGEGRPPRSARRMMRRLLEHEWEHVRELRSRLGTSVRS